MKLLIVRHGQSKGNIDKSVYFKMPDWAVPLTNTGVVQAAKVAGGIIDHLYLTNFNRHDDVLFVNSPYVRTKETSNVIEKHLTFSKQKYKKIETPLIREREWGKLREEYESFKTREERNHLFDFYRRPENGESFADCYQRAWNFLNWLKTQDNQLVIIVSHGEFIKMMLMIIDNIEVEDFETIQKVKNCELIIRDF